MSIKSITVRMGAVLTLLFGVWMPTHASAVTIGFEGFAPSAGLVNISAGTPYMESGFTITPTNSNSAVFDSAAVSTMIGNSTDWFGFAENNIPSLTLTGGPGSFNLVSVLIGPSTIASATPINLTIDGFLFGGGMLSSTFTNLTSATTAILNWTNLVSVNFTTTDDAGLDDIVLTQVPEPGTLALFSLGLVGLGFARRKRRQTA